MLGALGSVASCAACGSCLSPLAPVVSYRNLVIFVFKSLLGDLVCRSRLEFILCRNSLKTYLEGHSSNAVVTFTADK